MKIEVILIVCVFFLTIISYELTLEISNDKYKDLIKLKEKANHKVFNDILKESLENGEVSRLEFYKLKLHKEDRSNEELYQKQKEELLKKVKKGL